MGEVNSFQFKGKLSSSKSLYNRCLIVQSFFSEFEIKGRSNCDDVMNLKKCLRELSLGKSKFHCGSGGTTFRFLIARLSREKGRFKIEGDQRLLERPHEDLYKTLETLGCKIFQKSPLEVEVIARGWVIDRPIKMSLKTSSQYISAILLSAWQLNKELIIELDESKNSFSYFEMTLELLKKLGMDIQVRDNKVIVLPWQTINQYSYDCEPDMSSAFTLAALATAAGNLCLQGFPQSSLQPDFAFIKILQDMNVNIYNDKMKSELFVDRSMDLKPLQVDLKDKPDLFPVLGVLLSRAEGESQLHNLEVLSYKESNRLEKLKELLSNLNVSNSHQNNTLKIFGKKEHQYQAEFSFNPDQDHRMVMAACLAKYQGAKIRIQNPEVVNKSFPEFLKMVKL